MRFVLPNVDQVVDTLAGVCQRRAGQCSRLCSRNGGFTPIRSCSACGPMLRAPGTATPFPNNSDCMPAIELPGFNPATPRVALKPSPPRRPRWRRNGLSPPALTRRSATTTTCSAVSRLTTAFSRPTLDPISPNFDALSNQPSWDVQAQETHVFGPRSTNAFTATLSHYVAQFQQDPSPVAQLPVPHTACTLHPAGAVEHLQPAWAASPRAATSPSTSSSTTSRSTAASTTGSSA